MHEGSFPLRPPAPRRTPFSRTLALSLTLGLALVAPGAGLPAQQTAVAPAPRTGAEGDLDLLRAEIERLSEPAEGRVGVGVLHLESGREVYVHGDEGFPMASTYKVPIAVQLLTRVERGEVRLDSLVSVRPGHLHPGSGTLTPLFDDPGVLLSVRNLTDLMLQISDNSATDLVLDVAGGGEAVTARMGELGFSGIRVDRPTVELIGDYAGIEELPPSDEITSEVWDELTDPLTEEVRDSARVAFDHDPQDTATPRAMTRLLEGIWEAEFLSRESSDLLLEIMYGCRTGENRLKGMLPPDTEVAHKTGTIGRTTSDVGIIDLPHGAGHVVVVVFVKESEVPIRERERVIAQIARAAHDWFTFRAGESGG